MGQWFFTADDLLCAAAEIMGKSTYGTLYKTTLKDGNQVLVKRLREKISKGQKEFENEVDVLGKIRHPSLLALRACYSGPKERKILFSTTCLKGLLQHSSIKSINSFNLLYIFTSYSLQLATCCILTCCTCS